MAGSFRHLPPEDERMGADPTGGLDYFLGREPAIRHCEERSDEAIHSSLRAYGLLRGACHRARIRATRWLAMTKERPARLSRRDRRRHGEKRPGHVPEQLAVGGKRNRVSRSRQDNELAVTVRQPIKELLEVGDGGDAVIFAARQEHRRKHLL